MRSRTVLSWAVGFLLLLVNPAWAAKDKLVAAFGTGFGNLDVYKSTQRVTIDLGYLLWDALVERDPVTGKITPNLATSWRIVDDTTWEFKLQSGVKFHNGNPLNAECVRFTIEDRILAPEQNSPQAVNFRWVKKVEVVDDLTFRVITDKPYPVVLERFNVLFVYDPVETKAKGDQYVAENPMGTGPYRFVKWDRDTQIVMTANPGYWKPGIPKIKDVTIRVIPEMSTRAAELISGGIQLIVDAAPDHFDTLKKAKHVEPQSVPVLRFNFWQFDGSGRAGQTPLTDRRVRRAIWHAIDREAIVKNVMSGFGDVLNSPMSPYQFGFDPTVKGYEYDPEKARTLLREAGVEKGFAIDLWQYEDWHHQVNQAAMGYLEKVGIKVTLKDYRGNIGQLITLRNAGKVTGIGNYTWGSYNIFDADAAMTAWFLTSAPSCYNPDPEIDGWLTQARFTLDEGKRKELYAKAQKKIIDEAYWMPLFAVHIIWARHKDLAVEMGRDQVCRIKYAYWK